MAIRKKNGKWIVDVTIGNKPNGKKDRRKKTCRTKQEAERVERTLLLKKDAHLVSGKITIDDFIADVFWPQKKHLKPSTKINYKRDINLRILPHLSGKYIEDISRYDIQQMISECATRKVATNARETLSSILGLAYDLEMVPRNVAGLRYTYPPASIKPDNYYGTWLSTFEEHRKFIEAAEKDGDESVLRMSVLGLCFGLRKGEVFGLDWEMVNLNEGYIRIVQTYASGEGGAYLDEPKTQKAIRSIPITSFAKSYIEQWDIDKRTGPLLRTWNRRMAPATGKAILQRFCARHPEVPRVTLFSMRHSFGTACINAGIPAAQVSAWMGHEDISTTINRYVKPKLGDLKNAANVIDQAMFL